MLIVAVVALPVSVFAVYPIVVGASKAHAALGLALLWSSRHVRLAERVEELTESRSRAVEAAIAERRRIEVTYTTVLNKGSSLWLSALAWPRKMATDPETAREFVEEAHEEAKRTLAEIRNLVRGIHPAVLTDRGLNAAISALVVRCPVPVEVDVELDGRPPEAAETTAYFVVAEGLANVAKHSGASEAQVFIRHEHNPHDRLVIGVVDEGKGGADPEAGSGFAGLADRLAALDGRLFVKSLAGGPTHVCAELPYGTFKETAHGAL